MRFLRLLALYFPLELSQAWLECDFPLGVIVVFLTLGVVYLAALRASMKRTEPA